jgi:anti-anti-sigma factor
MESGGSGISVPSGRADSEPLRHALRPRGPVRFGITEAEHGDAVTLEIAGELDVLTAPKFSARLNTVVRRSERDVVVDLRKADFLDSAGLQILLGVQRRLSNDARKLSVVCEAGPVRRVIELARLGDILGLVAVS